MHTSQSINFLSSNNTHALKIQIIHTCVFLTIKTANKISSGRVTQTYRTAQTIWDVDRETGKLSITVVFFIECCFIYVGMLRHTS